MLQIYIIFAAESHGVINTKSGRFEEVLLKSKSWKNHSKIVESFGKWNFLKVPKSVYGNVFHGKKPLVSIML
jgi:hypothetical protein